MLTADHEKTNAVLFSSSYLKYICISIIIAITVPVRQGSENVVNAIISYTELVMRDGQLARSDIAQEFSKNIFISFMRGGTVRVGN